MAISAVSICNSALTKIGQERIASLDDTTKAAKICKDRYSLIVQEVLSDHPWNFAMKRASLAQLAETPAFEWTYTFQKPVDCLRVWRTEWMDTDFVVEGDKILTDNNTFNCTYISSDVSEGLFTIAFAEAVALRLAADVAYAITQSAQLQTSMMTLYETRLRIAKSNDAQEGTAEDIIETTWNRVRY